MNDASTELVVELLRSDDHPSVDMNDALGEIADERASGRVPLEVTETVPRGPVSLQMRTDLFFDTATSATDGNGSPPKPGMVVNQTEDSEDDIKFGQFVMESHGRVDDL